MKRLLGARSPAESQYGFHGDYPSWGAANANAEGFASAQILERVRAAARKVRQGEAAYERDGVAFQDEDYRWPLVACLLYVLSRTGRLSVLDLGGSLGSTFFQNRKFLAGAKDLRWSVVEQAHYVDCGSKEFADASLSFYVDLEGCAKSVSPNVVLASSSLQYFERPYEMLDRILKLAAPFLLFDRLAFNDGADRDRLTVQRVPPTIYPATYPAWFLSMGRFLERVEADYQCLAVFDGVDRANVPSVYRGLFFVRRRADSDMPIKE